jgi:hypothetical protein
MASFSSRGFTDDGRIKPSLCLPGALVKSSDSDGLTVPASNNCNYDTSSGTSLSTPAVSGCAALVRQYFTDGFYPTGSPVSGDAFTPSAALIKGILINSSVNVLHAAYSIPGQDQGWGRILLDEALYFPGDARKLYTDDHHTGLSTGESVEYKFTVLSGTEPLEITLVWTDYFSLPAAATNIVNDLNLELTTPSTTYYGNNFVSGESVAGGSPDNINTVECILLPAPDPGDYTLNIAAQNVAIGTQNYALVITGDHAFPPPVPLNTPAVIIMLILALSVIFMAANIPEYLKIILYH